MILYYIKLLKIFKSMIVAEKNYRKDKTHMRNIHHNIDCQQKNYSKKIFIMTFLEKICAKIIQNHYLQQNTRKFLNLRIFFCTLKIK